MKVKVTTREEELLNILWNRGEPMLASEIAKCGEPLTINTVQATIKNLLKKKLVKVTDIVYSGTVLSRRYEPTIDKTDFIKEDMANYFQKMKDDISSFSILSALLDSKETDVETLDKLEQLIKDKKEMLEKER